MKVPDRFMIMPDAISYIVPDIASRYTMTGVKYCIPMENSCTEHRGWSSQDGITTSFIEYMYGSMIIVWLYESESEIRNRLFNFWYPAFLNVSYFLYL